MSYPFNRYFLDFVCGAGVLFMAVASMPLEAQTITFDDGTYVDGPDDTAVADASEDVVSRGFRFSDHNEGDPGDPADDAVLSNAVVDDSLSGTYPGDNRVRSRDFGGALTLSFDGVVPFDLISFRLSNFTFNAGHTHAMEVTYNYADSTSDSALYTVGTEIPGDRTMESSDIVVNKTNLTSVVFANTQRLIYIDDLQVRVPEPSTVLLALFSVGVLASRRRLRL